MKQQIKRLSPHQNAKVFAVLMAVNSLVILLPFFLFSMAYMPMGVGPGRLWAPGMMLWMMPLLYFAVGYVVVAIACWVYNLLVPLIGGIEFDLHGEGDAAPPA